MYLAGLSLRRCCIVLVFSSHFLCVNTISLQEKAAKEAKASSSGSAVIEGNQGGGAVALLCLVEDKYRTRMCSSEGAVHLGKRPNPQCCV